MTRFASEKNEPDTPMTFGKTKRGFALIEFHDRYGHECSLQKSSIAFEDCIWLGVDDAEPKVMASEAYRLGVIIPKQQQNNGQPWGWVEYPIPEEVSLYTRMHITQKQAGHLAKLLAYFANHGELPESMPGDAL